MLQLKPEGLAYELGDDWNQKKVSLLESKEVIDDAMLEQVATVLKVPNEAIESLTEDGAIHIIANTFNSNDNSATLNGYTIHYSPSFNAIDKIIELYEALVKSEKEKVEMLQRIIDERLR